MSSNEGKKRFNFISVGRKDEDLHPGPPGKNKLQQVVDIRGAIKDPKDILPDHDGNSQEVEDYILGLPGVPYRLAVWEMLVMQGAMDLEESDKDEMDFVIACEGGIQRSPCIANILHQRFQGVRGDDFEVTITHLSLEKKGASS